MNFLEQNLKYLLQKIKHNLIQLKKQKMEEHFDKKDLLDCNNVLNYKNLDKYCSFRLKL